METKYKESFNISNPLAKVQTHWVSRQIIHFGDGYSVIEFIILYTSRVYRKLNSSSFARQAAWNSLGSISIAASSWPIHHANAVTEGHLCPRIVISWVKKAAKRTFWGNKWDMTQDGHKCFECPPKQIVAIHIHISFKTKHNRKKNCFLGRRHVLHLFLLWWNHWFELMVCLIQHGSLLPSWNLNLNLMLTHQNGILRNHVLWELHVQSRLVYIIFLMAGVLGRTIHTNLLYVYGTKIIFNIYYI